jgi:cytochrome P450
MELSAATLLLGSFLSAISVMILVSLLGRESNKRRPPGPRCLPFIGSLHHLLTPTPQVALRDLAKKHGPVMYLQLGQVDAVVVSSPAAAQEVLRDSNLTFASRPSILVATIACYGNLDIAFSPYGAYWRTLRKLCTVELLSARKVRQFAAIRDSETLSLVRNVRDAGSGGRPVNIGRLVVSCANAITAKATFGEGCEPELQERFLSAMQVMLDLSGKISIGDLFPSLGFLDAVTGLRRRLWRTHGQLDAIFEEIIDGCEARREMKKTTTETAEDHDLLSVMLRIKDEGDLEFPIGRTNIKAVAVVCLQGPAL